MGNRVTCHNYITLISYGGTTNSWVMLGMYILMYFERLMGYDSKQGPSLLGRSSEAATRVTEVRYTQLVSWASHRGVWSFARLFRPKKLLQSRGWKQSRRLEEFRPSPSGSQHDLTLSHHVQNAWKFMRERSYFMVFPVEEIIFRTWILGASWDFSKAPCWHRTVMVEAPNASGSLGTVPQETQEI